MGMFLRRGPAPKRGTPIGSFDVGSTIKLNVSGTPWEFLVVHQGLPSDLYDASCDGAWLLMKDIYENRAWNSTNSNVYETSTINTWLNGDFLGLLDGNVRGEIKQVKIPCYNSSGGKLSCKVFLLSGQEIDLSGISGLPNDGDCLSYFNGAVADQRIAYLDGKTTNWFLRSQYTTSTSVWYITSRGMISNSGTTSSFGIRPAFILPSDFLVTDDMIA